MRHLHSSGRLGGSALCGHAYHAPRSQACRWDDDNHRNPYTGQPHAWCGSVRSRISCHALLARCRGIIHPLINQPNKETKPRITCPKKNAIIHLVGEVALHLNFHRGHVVAVQRPRLVAIRGRQGARGHQQLQDAMPLCRWQEHQTREDVVHHFLRLLSLLLVQVSYLQANEVPAELQHLHIDVFRSQVRLVAWPGDLLN